MGEVEGEEGDEGVDVGVVAEKDVVDNNTGMESPTATRKQLSIRERYRSVVIKFFFWSRSLGFLVLYSKEPTSFCIEDLLINPKCLI